MRPIVLSLFLVACDHESRPPPPPPPPAVAVAADAAVVAPPDAVVPALSGRKPGEDLAAQLDAAGDEPTAIAPRPYRGAGTAEMKLSGQKGYDDTTLTIEAVIAKIRSAYMPGITRCAKEELKRDPQARGTEMIDFKVNARGHTTKVTVNGLGARLDDCVKGVIAGWAFAIPKDAADKPVEAAFALVFKLEFVRDVLQNAMRPPTAEDLEKQKQLEKLQQKRQGSAAP